MTILSYVVKDGYLRVTTDHPARNEFAYPADMFSSIEALEAEISRSVAFENQRNSSKSFKSAVVSSSLKLSGAVDRAAAVVVD